MLVFILQSCYQHQGKEGVRRCAGEVGEERRMSCIAVATWMTGPRGVRRGGERVRWGEKSHFLRAAQLQQAAALACSLAPPPHWCPCVRGDGEMEIMCSCH